ncbi:MAG TPA: exodeoxyribonuclease VII large subunit [Rhodocyclaceae bacterium]|nr:exodeoxyribonuclease VII large subunit [Rhodocyclaceae bacterium]HRQ46410.1 exodeoxyribonuclease VII large subunit [Rhodocyclaceae bacterium]
MDHPTQSPEYDAEPCGPESILSVSALNRLARATLERHIPVLRVGGEISNLTRASSGHLYFTLKDDQAQVRCTMWRNRARLLAFHPENGMQVELRALVTLYEIRGDFQLSVESLRRAGTGNLFEAFVRLREKLAAEGLFDPTRKRTLPRFPRAVGVITSPAAAALQDVLAAFRRRAPHLEIMLYPAPVQGDGAAAALTASVRLASDRAATDGIDLLLLVRGGGSLEDLWAFNDEALARAIRRCPVPVVTGIGHETDVCIADFAADVRAATPTGAAELASAGFHEAAGRLATLSRDLAGMLQARLHMLEQRLDRAALRLRHPGERLAQSGEYVDRLRRMMEAAISRRIERSTTDTRLLALRLGAARPDLLDASERCARLAQGLARAGRQFVVQRRQRLDALSQHLEHLGPQAVLNRGYSVTRDAHGNILRSASDVEVGTSVTIELAQGTLDAAVTRTGA